MLKILIDATARPSLREGLPLRIKKVSLFEDTLCAVIVEKSGDIDLVVTIEQILKEQNLNLKQIDKFDFIDGEGSFTGIKNSAAVANVLEWAIKKIPANKLRVPKYSSEPNIQKHDKIAQ